MPLFFPKLAAKFVKMFYLPFHAAEQRNKERIRDSAERLKGVTFRSRPLFAGSAGQFPERESSDRLSFHWFISLDKQRNEQLTTFKISL
jgi:hypothetical protein